MKKSNLLIGITLCSALLLAIPPLLASVQTAEANSSEGQTASAASMRSSLVRAKAAISAGPAAVFTEATKTAGAAAAPPATPVAEQKDDFNKQVAHWMTELAKQPTFKSWKQAKWDRTILGPGTHSWLVGVHKDGKDAGYMIVSAAQDGSYVLSEYGTGNPSLYSQKPLYQSMKSHKQLDKGITLSQFKQSSDIQKKRLYYDGLTAIWKVKTPHEPSYQYYDAKDGEPLPLTEAEENKIKELPPVSPNTGRSTLKSIKMLPPFDPYNQVSWLDGSSHPLDIHSFGELSYAIEHQERLTYVAMTFEKKILTPYAVRGYAQWSSGEPYVILDDYGLRCIPMSVIMRYGQFYKQSGKSEKTERSL